MAPVCTRCADSCLCSPFPSVSISPLFCECSLGSTGPSCLALLGYSCCVSPSCWAVSCRVRLCKWQSERLLHLSLCFVTALNCGLLMQNYRRNYICHQILRLKLWAYLIQNIDYLPLVIISKLFTLSSKISLTVCSIIWRWILAYYLTK